MEINKISGIILAGGKNSRIGTNKAFLKIEEKMIIEIIIENFKTIFDEIIIVTGSANEYISALQPKIVKKIKFIKDIFPDKGSLGGLYSGLINSKNKNSFVVGCDMPFLNIKLIQYMITLKNSFDIIVPKIKNNYESLHAIYSKECIEPIEKQLKQDNLKYGDFKDSCSGRIYPTIIKMDFNNAINRTATKNYCRKNTSLKISDFYKYVRIKEISENIIEQFDQELHSFINVNTTADYQKAKNIAMKINLDV